MIDPYLVTIEGCRAPIIRKFSSPAEAEAYFDTVISRVERATDNVSLFHVHSGAEIELLKSFRTWTTLMGQTQRAHLARLGAIDEAIGDDGAPITWDEVRRTIKTPPIRMGS